MYYSCFKKNKNIIANYTKTKIHLLIIQAILNFRDENLVKIKIRDEK